MIRYIRYIFLGIVGVSLVTVAMANRDPVTLRLVPDEIAEFFGVSVAAEHPLYLVIYGGIISGLLIGFIWEWIREHRMRAEAERAKREVSKLEREVKELKGSKKGSRDEAKRVPEVERRLRADLGLEGLDGRRRAGRRRRREGAGAGEGEGGNDLLPTTGKRECFRVAHEQDCWQERRLPRSEAACVISSGAIRLSTSFRSACRWQPQGFHSSASSSVGGWHGKRFARWRKTRPADLFVGFTEPDFAMR